jgi:hypothetical protein
MNTQTIAIQTRYNLPTSLSAEKIISLIAAAPDLLVALEDVSAKLERLCGVSYPDAIAPDLSQARAAIAKAHGQA